MKSKSSLPGSSPAARGECATCAASNALVEILRQEVARLGEDKRRLEDRLDKMMDKVVLFSERASQNEQALKMAQLAHMKPTPMDGLVNASSLIPDEMDMAVDSLMNEVMRSQ